MTLLRKYISAILKESSVIPEEVYKIPVVPYPEEGTREFAQDLARVIHQKSNRVVPEDLQGACDSDMEGLFEDYLSSKGITYNSSYFEKMVKDLRPIISTLKDFYNRPRPEAYAKKMGLHFRSDYLKSAQTPAYPSGHTIQAYVFALLLADQFPEEKEGLIGIAEMVSQSRIDRGVHFPSDVDFGRKIARLIVGEMLDK